MQQKLVLYIGNDLPDSRVDQFKDENVSFTQTIQNVKDLKKIFTEFTKTFALPASKKNNAIFKHYYNYDIADGFDARTKVDAFLELNDIPFKTGKIALTGVDLKNNIPHTYKVTFYGDTVNLKDILGDDQLSNLSELSDYNQSYDYTTVLDRMQNENLGNIIVPLITHTDRVYYDSSSPTAAAYGNLYFNSNSLYAANGVNFTQFKYAIRLQAIISAIETQYPSITFSNDFFNDTSNTDFYNLYMWLHRKKGNVEPTEEIQRVYTTTRTFVETSATNQANSVIQFGSLRLQLNYPQETPNQNNVFLSVTLSFAPTQQNTEYSVRVYNIVSGSVEVGGFIDQVGNQTIDFGNDLDNMGFYLVQIACASTIDFPINSIEWYVQSLETTFNPPPINQEFSVYRYKNSVAFSTSLTIEFNILEQIPKMKIIDFLTALFQMFNLTAYVENDTIVVQPLDEFYDKAPIDASTSQVIPVNIDQYLDTTKSSVDIALPFSKVNFTYKGVKTFLAQQFNQINNRVWGSSSYSLDGNIYDTPSTEYKIEIPFEHMMFERLIDIKDNSDTTIQYGFFVDDNQEPYIGAPLIFYKYKQTGFSPIPEPITIRDLSNTRTGISSYFVPMNSKDINPAISKVNIHFDNYINEYKANNSADATAFTDTLFQTQYSNYINEVFSATRRLTKVTAYLPYKIFSSLQLYDRIEIGQKYYKINSMTTDLTTGKTDFELLNCDL